MCAPAKINREPGPSNAFSQVICGQSYSPSASKNRDTLKSPACTASSPFFVSVTMATPCAPSVFVRQRPRTRLESSLR
jgi:hypothetical protein